MSGIGFASLFDRRRALGLMATIGMAFPSAEGAAARSSTGDRPRMKIVCFIRYQIDPFQREAFQAYAQAWGPIIPRCGGELVGYFLPCEGTNDIGWGLIAFDSLAAYEAYKTRLRADPDARANFALARSKRFILREERNFVEVVDGTFGIAAQSTGTRR